MDSFPPYEISSTASLLCLAISSVALLMVIALVFLPKENASSIKLVGSLMVLALAFAANSSGVYGLAIFIIATLVTDLDFLEKIAAIFWRNDKYWEYRAGRASASEIKEKRASEVVADSLADQVSRLGTTARSANVGQLFKSKSELINKAISYEQAVIAAIKEGKWPITNVQVRPEFALRSSRGVRIYDAIVEAQGMDFLVEIKYSERPNILVDLLEQLKSGVVNYQNYLSERNIYKKVIPVGIVPASTNAPSLFRDEIAILKFDYKKREFTNSNEFLNAAAHLLLKKT